MLGAGASMTSGVKSTPAIKKALLDKYGNQHDKGTDEERFDALWEQSNRNDRARFLEEYLKGTPSEGYRYLARLIEAGWFRVAVTFNFDRLLEQALEAISFKGMQRIVNGETRDEEMAGLVDMPEPAFKLVKLHGSLMSTNQFFFDISEMLQYPKPIADLLEKLTLGDIVMCGYGFRDVCVQRTFSTRGGQIVVVNPNVPEALRGYLKERQSLERSIDLGFDDFFKQLHDELFVPAAPAEAKPPRPPNPFKFLQSCDDDDHASFHRRDDEIATFGQLLDRTPPPQVIIVAGANKAGKTSLVRAGLSPTLAGKGYEGFYVRCKDKFEQSVATTLWPDDPKARDLTVQQIFDRLSAAAAGKGFVLLLDQFDRSADAYKIRTKEGKAAFAEFLTEQLLVIPPRLTLTLVIETALVQPIVQACLGARVAMEMFECSPFDGKDVRSIVTTLAAQAQAPFDSRIVDDLVRRYEEHSESLSPENRFTMAHVQTVCHILAAREIYDFGTYEQEFKSNNAALHRAINVCDFISFVEDFESTHASWFRNMVRVPLDKSKEEIADFIKAHYLELVPTPDPRKARKAPGGPT